MSRPIIGVIPLVDMKKNSYWMLPGYLDALLEAGGTPFMLPLTSDLAILEQLSRMCDGFLFTGGQDISPDLYGEAPLPSCKECCRPRDEMEKSLFRLLYEQNKPVLGICRGIQAINAFLGGTLYQDLPMQAASSVEHHQSPPYDKPVHKVEIIEDTPLFKLLNQKEISVNSYHHQAVKSLSPNLKMMACSPDGITEAVYAPKKKYVWAVQWHPEFSYLKDDISRKIFRSFIEAAR
ncbi:gamma-glutamyl-gamma-aminobutyrate hydrolase family protein [Lactonifactor longoviformis]|uniref:Putative glutamine amidotransferase n=1 Tax=Lactonifactor longoviformis DSM 17459 TaxID=1122155 RepID=A0A1M4Y4X7_9CLOT|nr:gamma-glutamyl-gamma-aminobutyrate hydrolase family protein [Lactonifactor longoviformis]POP35001.1 gamma-glutamyl-gamma-aminobutyrate hydrolase family protein [Lactonifactor longoviformis]SHF00877.1 putative glutamine amidotransferase [Lactonifactor longoviformis DSM 17459]